MKHLEDYEPILAQALRLSARQTSFVSTPGLAQILDENPRLVVAINHSTPLSWLPAIALLVVNSCARGGGKRQPMGVMDRFFFQVPFFRELAALITQSENPLTFRELIEKFENQRQFDLVVFPEGSNCFFGKPEIVQEFRSPKFAEISIRTGTPILIVAHKGSENWATSFTVPEVIIDKLKLLPQFAADFLERRLRETGKIVIPLWPAPMQKFSMACELYTPLLRFEDLSREPEERRSQVTVESERARVRMQSLLDSLAK